MSKARTPKDEPRFEEAVEQLEQIIEQIESGEVGLEESLLRYEQGMKLIARCQAILNKAQQRIAELTADPDGSLHVRESGADDTTKEQSE